MVKRDFTHLTPDEKINGIKASKLPDHIRSKYHGEDVREAIAQSTEMAIQLGINMGLSPDDAISWARKLQEAIPRSEFDSWVATLVDGGPSIFMNTLNELKDAYPNGASGVALVRETDPAKIYVWNGSAWEDFGDYQGFEVKDQGITTNKLADGAVTASKLSESILEEYKGKNYLDGVDIIDGYYVDIASGELVSTVSHSVTDFINLDSVQEYLLSNSVGGEFTNARIVFYDKSNRYIIGYRINGGAPTEVGEFKVPDGYSKARISVQRTASPDYSTWHISIKDFKVITNLDLGGLQPKLTVGEGLNLDNNELRLNFIEAGDLEVPADGVYNRTNLNDYRNTSQDGYMILEDGQIVTTSATLPYTTTNPIPVSGGEQFSFVYRAIYFGDSNNTPLGYLSNITLEKNVFEVPTGATQMVVVAALDKIESTVIDRLTPRNEDVPIKFTREIQGIGTGTGEAYDQKLNTFNDVEFNSVKTNTLDVSGTIPTGTLSSPPSGLLSGDMWADTTDSATHPIVRVML